MVNIISRNMGKRGYHRILNQKKMNTLIKEEIVSMIKVSTVEDVENKIKELEDKYQYYEDNLNMVDRM